MHVNLGGGIEAALSWKSLYACLPYQHIVMLYYSGYTIRCSTLCLLHVHAAIKEHALVQGSSVCGMFVNNTSL